MVEKSTFFSIECRKIILHMSSIWKRILVISKLLITWKNNRLKLSGLRWGTLYPVVPVLIKYFNDYIFSTLAADAFSAVNEAVDSSTTNGPIYEKPEVKHIAEKFHRMFLVNGSGHSMMKSFRQFRGRDPSYEALLFSLGLKKTSTPKMRSHSWKQIWTGNKILKLEIFKKIFYLVFCFCDMNYMLIYKTEI